MAGSFSHMCEYNHKSIHAANTATVALVSGGVDSVGMLYRLLRETDSAHKVVAHHVNFINGENRYNVEYDVFERVCQYLKTHVRDFETSHSVFELPFDVGTWDIINAMYIGGIVTKKYARQHSLVYLCVGDTKDDFGAYKWRSPIAQSLAMISSLEDPRIAEQKNPRIIQPVVHMTKSDIVRMLPEELFNLTWSCRRPVFIEDGAFAETCGVCAACNDLKAIEKYVFKRVAVTPYFNRRCARR
jgi:7-cyano-7-deazaguanine synthase in queuosine biosynthesis